MPFSEKRLKTVPAISLFSGAGGLDLGLEAAGFDTRCCLEIDFHSCSTLQMNRNQGISTGQHSFLRNAQIIQKDIRDTSADDLLRNGNLKYGEVGLLYGGPPCQAFSVFGRRAGLKDPRGTLIWEFVRLVGEILPQAFLLENVSGLKTFAGQSLLGLLERKLSLNGEYTVTTHEYELADFGVPQCRRRLFVIGNRHNKLIPEMERTHSKESGPCLFNGLKPYRTAGEALRDLPEPGLNGHIPNHKGRIHSERIIRRYASLAFGARDPKTRINKLDPTRPSYTIIVGSDAGGGKGHVHPYSPREVTPRESARMQTFPDFWEFSGTTRHPIRQVGNAVPPLFAAQLGSHLRKHIFGVEKTLSCEEAINILQLHYLK